MKLTLKERVIKHAKQISRIHKSKLSNEDLNLIVESYLVCYKNNNHNLSYHKRRLITNLVLERIAFNNNSK